MKSQKLLEILDDPEMGKEKPDAIALMILYQRRSFVRNKKRLSSVKVGEAANMLSISVHRVRKAKKVLIKKNFIAQHSEQNPLNQVEHFIKVLD